jgi:hypothetical protein
MQFLSVGLAETDPSPDLICVWQLSCPLPQGARAHRSASRSWLDRLGSILILDGSIARVLASQYMSRRSRPSFASPHPPQAKRAQGRPGGRMHPGPARKKIARRRVDHWYRRRQPAFPARWFTAYRRSPGEPSRLPPSSMRCASIVTNLAPDLGAPGPHHFAVRKCAARQQAHLASTALRATLDAPLIGAERGELKQT